MHRDETFSSVHDRENYHLGAGSTLTLIVAVERAVGIGVSERGRPALLFAVEGCHVHHGCLCVVAQVGVEIGHSQAIRLAPQDAENYDSRGSVYRSLGQHERADLDLAKATELRPDI